MQSGLRIKLIESLKAKYPDYLTLDEAEAICKAYKYKMSNLERRTRNDSKAQTVKCHKIKNAKGVIIGYRHIPNDVNIPIVGTIENKQVKLYKTPKETITDGLNAQIKDIIHGTTVSWDNQEQIKELQEALKSGNEYRKRAVIEKYRLN